jgi:hypothetical protein
LVAKLCVPPIAADAHGRERHLTDIAKRLADVTLFNECQC